MERGKQSGYEIHEAIGEGAMGTVYRASTKRGEPRALKILDENLLEDPEAVQRFEREGKLIHGLEHPNICRVFRYGKRGDFWFIEMELVGQGDSVADEFAAADGEPLPVPRVVEILYQTAQGLAFLHANNVVHRDVKPENLLIADDGTIKMADFGFARHTNEPPRVQGRGIGTPHYMPPEQFETPGVDPLADVYALGVVGYLGLTGQLPFPGDGVKQVRDAQRQGPAASVQSLRKDTPGELANLIDEMIGLDPARRPAGMETVLHRLIFVRGGRGASTAFPAIRVNEQRTKTLAKQQLFVTGETPTERIQPMPRGQTMILLGLGIAAIAALLLYLLLVLK